MDDYFMKARLLQIECKMQGMIAENKQREKQGYSMAYGEDAFQEVQDEIQRLIDGGQK
jgi:hypothetical protein